MNKNGTADTQSTAPELDTRLRGYDGVKSKQGKYGKPQTRHSRAGGNPSY